MRRWDMTEEEHAHLMAETTCTRQSLRAYTEYLEAKLAWKLAKAKYRKRQRKIMQRLINAVRPPDEW